MAGLVGVLIGIAFSAAGLATLTDFRRFGTRTVENIPSMFRFGTVDTHHRVIGAGWLAFGVLAFGVGVIGLALLL